MANQNPFRFLYPVRLKHKETGRYLYSTNVRYRAQNSSGQQIVAAVPEVDENCVWIVKHPQSIDEVPPVGFQFNSGDTLRLEHETTHKNLHSHGDRTSPTTRQKEVTAFGGLGVGDSNDDWDLTILSVVGDGSSALVSLRHSREKHFLHSQQAPLSAPPKAGAHEVSGSTKEDDPNNVWIAEVVAGEPSQLSKVSVSIDIPERNITAQFETSTSLSKWVDAANKWIDSEVARWAWLPACIQKVPEVEKRALSQTLALIERGHTQLRNAVREVVSSHDNESLTASLASFSEVFGRVYGLDGGILYSKEPMGVFICDYAESNPEQAAAALGVFLGANPATPNANAVRGVNSATAFLEGRAPNAAAAHKAAMDELRAEWQAAASATLSPIQKNIDASESKLKALDAQTSAFRERAEKLFAEKTAEIAALIETLNQKVALDASINYWKERATKAHRKAVVFGRWSGVAIGAFVVVLAVQCIFLFSSDQSEQLPINPSTAAGNTTGLPPSAVVLLPADAVQSLRTGSAFTQQGLEKEEPAHQYWRYLVVGITLTFAVWICRVLVRVTMSNLHIAADSEERVTMLQTFLSLMSDKSINQKEDIKLILQTVFRPGNIGLIDKETGIQTPLELVMKKVSGDE